MRWVVVVLLAGCFSKPGLRDRDGGDVDSGLGGDGGGADGGGNPDGPVVVGGCQSWGAWSVPSTIFANGPERFGPWLSPDALTLVFQMGTMIYQVERPTVGTPFGSATPIYTAATSGDLQPFLSDDQLRLWIDDASGNLFEATRSTSTQMFANVMTIPGPIGSIGETVEDVAVSGDGLRMIVTSGPSAQNEDLYLSTRSTTSQAFGALGPALSINAQMRNDCCAAFTESVFMWTRETPTGSYEIREVGWDGNGNFAGAGVAIPELGASDVWHSPALNRDGTRLVVVRNAPPNRDLYEASRVCMDP